MRKITEILIISGALIFLGVSLFVGQSQQPIDGLTLGAPTLSYQKSLLPITTNLYDIGSSTPSKIWNRLFVNYASTTAITSTTASTTNAIISGLLNCDTIDTSANGTLSCGTDSLGTGAPFAWTPTADGNSTSTRLIFGNGFISQASSTFSALANFTKKLHASSTSIFDGLATFGNASTSQISASNSYLGNVLSGVWNGTAIGDTYISSATNWNTAYTNRITSASFPLTISATTPSL